jgi:hypothetical protein
MTLSETLFAVAMALLPPCAVEDDWTCYWDASAMGNGRGVSFVLIEGGAWYP